MGHIHPSHVHKILDVSLTYWIKHPNATTWMHSLFPKVKGCLGWEIWNGELEWRAGMEGEMMASGKTALF
jgi:hypothetical protein